MSLFDVSGKRAIVTGGSRGLGRAMAIGLMENECEVAIVAFNKNTEETVKSWVKPGWKYHCISADLGNASERERAFNEALAALDGKLDILINAAGIQRRNKCVDYTLEDWDAVININLTSVFFMSQAAARVMVHQGHGKIINIASTAKIHLQNDLGIVDEETDDDHGHGKSRDHADNERTYFVSVKPKTDFTFFRSEASSFVRTANIRSSKTVSGGSH